MATPGPEVSVGQGPAAAAVAAMALRAGRDEASYMSQRAAQSRTLEKWAPWFRLAISEIRDAGSESF